MPACVQDEGTIVFMLKVELSEGVFDDLPMSDDRE